MTKTKTMTKKMTTLYFQDYYGYAWNFLGLAARPKDHAYPLHIAVASPAQIAKIKHAIADSVRYEVKYIKGRGTHPATVRVYTYGTHKEEVRQEISALIAWLSRNCLSAVDDADRLASDDANPLPPRFHKRRVGVTKGSLNLMANSLVSRVCDYIDPAFMEYPRRGRKTPSKP